MLDIDGCKRTMASIRFNDLDGRPSGHCILATFRIDPGVARSWELHHAMLKTVVMVCAKLTMLDNVWWCWPVTSNASSYGLKMFEIVFSYTSHVVLMRVSQLFGKYDHWGVVLSPIHTLAKQDRFHPTYLMDVTSGGNQHWTLPWPRWDLRLASRNSSPKRIPSITRHSRESTFGMNKFPPPKLAPSSDEDDEGVPDGMLRSFENPGICVLLRQLTHVGALIVGFNWFQCLL